MITAGDALYEGGDYGAAADAYVEAAALGGLDTAHAVRLGNAYVRLGAPGRAMAAYRGAQAFAPRDPALRANEAWLRAQLSAGAASAAATPAAAVPGDAANAASAAQASDATNGTSAQGSDPSNTPPASTSVFAPATTRLWSATWWAEASRVWVTMDELAALALFLWWLAVGGLWIGRSGGPHRGRRAARLLGVVCLALTLVVGGLLGIRGARRASATTAIVIGPGPAAVRQGPGTPFAALRALPEGADVRYVERRGRWLRLAEAGGVDEPGWVLAATVVDVPE